MARVRTERRTSRFVARQLIGRSISQAAVAINVQLFNRAVAHALLVEGFKAHEVRQIVGLLNRDVFPDLLDQIERRLRGVKTRGVGKSTASLKRLRDLVAANAGLIQAGLRIVQGRLSKDLKKFALSEAEWQRRVMAGATRGLGFDFITPSPQVLRSVVTSQPMQGQFLKKWFDELGRSTQTQVTRAMNIGISQGEAVGTIMSRVRLITGVTRRHAETIVRTAVNHVSSHAREAAYLANQDIIKRVQFVATLDDRTSFACQSLDGRIFKIGEGERPPIHPRCRSTTVPVLKSWKELGINLKEAPPGTRAALGGQVAAKTTYEKWLKRQSSSLQNKVLGPTRAKLFRRGVSTKRFVDSRGRTLTLEELERQEEFLVF